MLLGPASRLAAASVLLLALALLSVGRFGLTSRWWVLLPLLAALAVIVVTDLSTRRIPDVITVPGIVYCLVVAAFRPGGLSVAQAGLGIAFGGGAALLLAIVSRGGIGGGDVKLMALLGGALGWKGALVVFVLSQIGGGAIAVGLLLVGRQGRGDHLPVGSVIALLGALFLIGQP